MPVSTGTAKAVGDKVSASWATNNVKAPLDDIYSTSLDTAIGSVAANFTVSNQSARIALGGNVVQVVLGLTYTGAGLTATSGNIPDTACFTLDSAYWPTEQVYGGFSGTVTGGFFITTAGVVTLSTASDTVTTSAGIRITIVYLLA